MTELKCPKCGGDMEDISGKFVCVKCFHSLDGPNASPSPAASAPTAAAPTAVAPAQAAAPSPGPTLVSHNTPAGGKDWNAPLPTIPMHSSSAPMRSGVCPKCGGETTDAGGRLVCSKCFWVVDGAPTPVYQSGSTAYQPAQGNTMMAFAVVVTVFFMLALFFVIQWNNAHPKAANTGETTTTSPSGLNLPGTPVPPQNGQAYPGQPNPNMYPPQQGQPYPGQPNPNMYPPQPNPNGGIYPTQPNPNMYPPQPSPNGGIYPTQPNPNGGIYPAQPPQPGQPGYPVNH